MSGFAQARPHHTCEIQSMLPQADILGFALADDQAAGGGDGLDVQVESFPVLMCPQGPDFSPDGILAFTFHHVSGVSRAVLGGYCHCRCLSFGFSGHAVRGRSGVQRRRADEPDCNGGSGRGLPSGKRLDALRAGATGAYTQPCSWPRRYGWNHG
jgi:hypothetical protein